MIYSILITTPFLGPEMVDYLGWCTWDSFYTDLTSARVIEGLRSFGKTGVTPRFLILDDGWQGTTVNDRVNGHQWRGRLVSFKANFKFARDYDGSIKCSDKSLSTIISDRVEEDNHPIHILPGAVGRDAHANDHSLEHLIEIAKCDLFIKKFFIWHTLTGRVIDIDKDSFESGYLSHSIQYC